MSLLKYEEEVVSFLEMDTREEALKNLDQIRLKYSAYNGWIEVKGYIEQLKNGKWRAVRYQKKI